MTFLNRRFRLTDLRGRLPLLTSGNTMFSRRYPTIGAEFGIFPEAPGYTTIGTLYRPGLATIGTIISNTTNCDSAAGALIPFCHFALLFYSRLFNFDFSFNIGHFGESSPPNL